jgi:hypothetical protein
MLLALQREDFKYLSSKLCSLLIYFVDLFICLIFLKEICDGGGGFPRDHPSYKMTCWILYNPQFVFDIGHSPSVELILLLKAHNSPHNLRPKN